MDINTEIHKAFEVIQSGGIILYPTDTVWGIETGELTPTIKVKRDVIMKRYNAEIEKLYRG